MPSDQIAQKVIALISENQGIPEEKISLDTKFAEIGIDSLAALGIIADLENEFNIAIPNDKALLITNVRQVVESIEEFLCVGSE